MAEKNCNKCNSDLGTTKENFKCSKCGASFHTSCIKNIQSDPNKKNSLRSNWKCDDCLAGANSAKKDDKCCSDTSSVIDAIAALREDFNKRLDHTNSKLDKFQTDLCNIVKDNIFIKAEIEKIKSKSNSDGKIIASLTNEN
jgi:hypothetical protein